MDYVKKCADRLRAIAIRDHEKHPQYAGYFDGWVYARAVKAVGRYKGGSVLPKYRCVLASPDLRSWYDPDTGHVCCVESGVLRQER